MEGERSGVFGTWAHSQVSADRVPVVWKPISSPGTYVAVRLWEAVAGGAATIATEEGQHWYWGTWWQHQEAQAEKDIEEGRIRTFDTMEELLASLDEE